MGEISFFLFAVELEHFALFEVAFEVVVDVDGAYASGSACIEHIARLEGEELRDIGDDLVDTVEHVGGAAFLYGLLGTHSPMAAEPSKPLQIVQGCPASEARFCRSRAVKSMPTVNAS